jgi:hypothetical protein
MVTLGANSDVLRMLSNIILFRISNMFSLFFFNVRLEELQVLDIKFLHGCVKSTIVIIYQVCLELIYFYD